MTVVGVVDDAVTKDKHAATATGDRVISSALTKQGSFEKHIKASLAIDERRSNGRTTDSRSRTMQKLEFKWLMPFRLHLSLRTLVSRGQATPRSTK